MSEEHRYEIDYDLRNEIANLLGCIPHPNDILQGIRDLKKRAAFADQKRNERAQLISTELRNRLSFIGITEIEMKIVDDKLDDIGAALAVNADPNIAVD